MRPGSPGVVATVVLVSSMVSAMVAGCGSGGSDGSAANRPGLSPARPVTTASLPPAPNPTPSRSTPAPSRPAPQFSWRVSRVRAADLGRSWRPGCPVGPAALRAVEVSHWGFDGRVHTGVLILHRDVVRPTRAVFAAMFREGFPVRRIRPVSEYGASDDRSMAADNTSAFNCRRAVAAGPPTWSRHVYGKAIDVNPRENPYLFGGRVLPPEGRVFRDRTDRRPGMIVAGDPVHRAFLRAGYRWGGTFRAPDYQHFDR